jgi:hypothetical protein
MSQGKYPTTHEKALQINIDARRYGTFAEIGAGQEVARWFFRVGGAAGTVAKTMSAYDMTVSDAVYGPAKRCVSRERLQSMLDHEWTLLLERLDRARGDKTAFFVFADTVATRSFTRQEDGTGWLGIRFQTEPRSEPSDIIIHTRFWEKEVERQQEALGVLGVNLVHGAFYHWAHVDLLIQSLLDGLSRTNVEVDMIKCRGPAFAGVDNRLLSLQLVEKLHTDSAMFEANGEVVEPAEILHKKPVLVERGSFRTVTGAMLDMLSAAQTQLRGDAALNGKEPVVVMEMTLHNLMAEEGRVDYVEFLRRVDALGAIGHTVMISNHGTFHRLARHLRRFTGERITMVLGIPTLEQVFLEKYYTDLEGGILESLGRLFKGPVKLLVYPVRNPKTGELVTAENFRASPHLQHLYAHLLQNGFFEPIRDCKL